MRKAGITVFLSLIFVLLVSFISALLSSASLQSEGNKKRLDVDAAVFSIFGEYQKDMLEYYDIFAVDAAYGGEKFSEQNLVDRMHYYGTDDIDHEITGIEYLTDHQGAGLREQVLSYMENIYGLSIITDLTGKSSEWEELELNGEEAEKEDEKISEQLEELIGAEETEGETAEGEESLPVLNEVKNSHLLTSVLPEEFQMSDKAVDLSGQVSVRPLNAGRGSFNVRRNLSGKEAELLFHEYILKKFNNALREDKPVENSTLDYEVEYLIGGKKSDAENLEAVVKKLFRLRLGINTLFLETSTQKQSQAGALALSLCSAALMPEAEEIVKQIIIGAWAYKESRLDVYILLSGGRLPPVKTEENFKTPITGIFGSLVSSEGNLDESGMEYSDFLRILLYFQDEDVLTMRALDRMEENIRSGDHAENFRVDQAVVKLRMDNKAPIYRGLTYRFPVCFGYR